MTTTKTRRLAAISLAAGVMTTISLLPITAGAQIYVTNFAKGTVGEYNLDGTVVNAKLISGLAEPIGIAISGSTLYVSNNQIGTIGEYTTSGKTINAKLLSALGNNNSLCFALSGSNIFVSNFAEDTISNTIGEYTTSGAVIQDPLISELAGPQGLAVSGGNLYVANSNKANGIYTIGKYSTSGASINSALITGLDGPLGIAVSGTSIFVTNYFSGTIGAYTTSGATINTALIKGLDKPGGIAIAGSHLYVTSGNGTVGEYNLNGTVVNAKLISGLDGPVGLAVVIISPSIVSTTSSTTVKPGASAKFLVVANGTGPLTYKWELNGSPLKNVAGNLSGVTTSTLTISKAKSANAGTYTVVVSNAAGFTSSTVMLKVS
jgi:hypothetical protein